MDLIYDAENVSIYHGLKLVTIHQRDDTPYTYTQKEAYGLPGHHGSYEKDLEEIYQRAGEIDNILRLYLKDVAEQAEYPPKAFRSCRGIMSLEKLSMPSQPWPRPSIWSAISSWPRWFRMNCPWLAVQPFGVACSSKMMFQG